MIIGARFCIKYLEWPGMCAWVLKTGRRGQCGEEWESPNLPLMSTIPSVYKHCISSDVTDTIAK
eukprot:scaffold144375_cov21-Tisochrysis_lutea.AAC.1